MTTAYVIPAKSLAIDIQGVPTTARLKDGTTVVIDRAQPQHLQDARALLNIAIEEGTSYPFEDPLDEATFKAYFLSHDAFVATTSSEPRELIGIFYIKPNFPGRCSHVCNGGFVVAPNWRGKGCATVMAEAFKQIAPQLGYKAAMFNLVFVTNEPSLRLWRSMGFQEIGRIPKVGRLKGLGYVDAIQFFYDFTA